MFSSTLIVTEILASETSDIVRDLHATPDAIRMHAVIFKISALMMPEWKVLKMLTVNGLIFLITPSINGWQTLLKVHKKYVLLSVLCVLLGKVFTHVSSAPRRLTLLKVYLEYVFLSVRLAKIFTLMYYISAQSLPNQSTYREWQEMHHP